MQIPSVPTRIALAPMAGGPGTPGLVAAVSNAGGIGFLPGGYLSAEAFDRLLSETLDQLVGPLGVNLFVPEPPSAPRLAAAVEYGRHVTAYAAGLDLPVAEPRWTDDDFGPKLDLVLRQPPDMVSFAFGLPDAAVVDALQERGTTVLATVNTVEEAEAGLDLALDGLVVQGSEAGAHRGGWLEPTGDNPGVLPLLQQVRPLTDRVLVAAGGLGNGLGVAAVLAAGADLAMLGTAFLRCPEAGTAAPHAAELAAGRGSVVTRVFTGRPARALRNDIVDVLEPEAPTAYPEVHFLTTQLRAEARARGDVERMHLWAGQASALAAEVPAGDLVRRLADDARAALERAPRPGDVHG